MIFNSTSKAFVGLGSFVFVVSSLLGFGGGFDFITSMQVSQLKTLKEGSSTYELWEKMPTPAYLGFYFFNLTNPKEFSEGAKPILREMGPYIYREDWQKQDVTFQEENSTVRYRMTKTFHFDDDMTDGSETDRVTIINPVFVATASMSHDIVEDSYLLQQFDKILTSKGESLVLTGTVRQFLFDGIPLKAYLDIFNNPAIKEILDDLEISLPDEMKDGKFALLKNKNGTDDGWYTIKTGVANAAEAGETVMYNDKSSLEYWTDSCNSINGSDGSIFPPFLNKESRIQVFAPGMCRSFSMLYHKDTKVQGEPALQFIMDQNVWKTPKSAPENACFCPPGKGGKESCDKEGVFNIGPCSDGAPLLLSPPHFVGAEDWIRDGVEGLEPEFDKHVTSIDFQPLTGTPLKAVNRIQFSVELVPHKDMPSFAKVKRAVVPFAWIEETTTFGEKEVSGVKSVLLLQTILGVAQYALMAVGGLLCGQGLLVAKNTKQHASPVKPFHNGDMTKSSISVITGETAFTF